MKTKTTLKEISDFMLNFLKNKDVNTRILDFWRNFETDKQFMYVATGAWASDDFDLNQDRDCLLQCSEVAPLMFNYLTETLGVSSDDYDSSVCNTMGVVEELRWLYKEQEKTIETKTNENNQGESKPAPKQKLTFKDYLLPRYEVMFTYPLCLFSKGDILVPLSGNNELYKNDNFRLKTGFVELEEQPEIHHKTIINHPHIFRKIEWWEHRTREQLPDKVQDLIDPHIKDISEYDINQIHELVKSSYFLPVVY